MAHNFFKVRNTYLGIDPDDPQHNFQYSKGESPESQNILKQSQINSEYKNSKQAYQNTDQIQSVSIFIFLIHHKNINDQNSINIMRQVEERDLNILRNQ